MSWAAWRCSKASRLAPGDTALAQLVLDEKVGALAGDRVILRDPSATRTMAGAAVIDPFGPPRNRRAERRLLELAALAEADDEVMPRLLRLESGFVDLGRFGLSRNLRPAEVEKLLEAAGGAEARRLRFSRRDARGGAQGHRRNAQDLP